MTFRILLAFALAVAAHPVLAHTGVGPAGGFAAGFGHPIGGADHVLAMVAVGVLASQMGGRALWLVPLAFVACMVLGGIAGMNGLPLPHVELGIIGSVVILGFVIAIGRRLPVAGAMALVAVFAVFHGHAHGTEMPVDASGGAYGLGFALATAFLHAAGLGLGIALARLGRNMASMVVRSSGGVIAAAGLLLLLA